jgi:hypothetical protein
MERLLAPVGRAPDAATGAGRGDRNDYCAWQAPPPAHMREVWSLF